jgi:hypothetical protein
LTFQPLGDPMLRNAEILANTTGIVLDPCNPEVNHARPSAVV